MGMRVVTALVVLLCIAGLSHALSFKVPPKTEDCFYQDILKGTDVAFHFQVTNGGALDIDCLVTGPDGDMLYSATREQEGKYFFSIVSGREARKSEDDDTLPLISP